MVALCVWLAPLWLTILLTVLVAVGMPVGWIIEDVKVAKSQEQPS